MNYELSNGQMIDDESLSEMMETLMSLRPHQSSTYTWDDIGTATLMSDVYENSIRYCPQNGCWYIWDGCWRKQGENGAISDRLQTMLNLLVIYCKEVMAKAKENDEEDPFIEDYQKYVKSIRKFTSMRNIMEVLKTMVRLPLREMDSNPYLLNTAHHAFDLKTGDIIKDITPFNVTKKTTCALPDFLSAKCDRWYQYVLF